MILFVKVEYCSSLFYVNKSITEVSAKPTSPFLCKLRAEQREEGSDSARLSEMYYVVLSMLSNSGSGVDFTVTH